MHKHPKYCPWCGADVKEFGHDDSCDRPEKFSLIVHDNGDSMYGFEK